MGQKGWIGGKKRRDERKRAPAPEKRETGKGRNGGGHRGRTGGGLMRVILVGVHPLPTGALESALASSKALASLASSRASVAFWALQFGSCANSRLDIVDWCRGASRYSPAPSHSSRLQSRYLSDRPNTTEP